jgi:hypothetical protein
MNRTAALLAGLTLFPAAWPAVAKERAAPDPYVARGKAVDCIPLRSIRSTQVRDDRTIDFIMTSNKIYRNSLPNSCPTLGSEKRFSYRTSQSQLCSVDIITVLYNIGSSLQPGASCGLGTFQPMERPARK